MKKSAITLMLMILVITTYAQSSKVVTAFNYHRQGQLDKARIAIDEAVVNEKTLADPKAWYYRGNIYLDIANSSDPAIKTSVADPLGIALDSYNKATQYDAKGLYKEDIQRYTQAIGESYYNEGVIYYNMGEFSKSQYSFRKAYEVNAMVGKTDTTALYNAAVSSELAGDPTNAIQLYNENLRIGNKSPEIYNSLGEQYKKLGDTTAAMNILLTGREIYPSDFNLLIAETNIYLAKNESEKALKNLETAIQIDNTNPSIFFAVGTIYDKLGMFEKAESAYLESIRIKPDFFDPNYNLGALYVNKAAEILEKANNLPLDKVKEYDEAKANADGLLAKSIPFLEKSHELQPDDVNTMISLKEIYTRLGMLDKAKGIDEAIHTSGAQTPNVKEGEYQQPAMGTKPEGEQQKK